jgi:hypothetical protein
LSKSIIFVSCRFAPNRLRAKIVVERKQKARRFLPAGLNRMIALYLVLTGLRRHVRRVMMVMAMSDGNHFETYASEPQ